MPTRERSLTTSPIALQSALSTVLMVRSGVSLSLFHVATGKAAIKWWLSARMAAHRSSLANSASRRHCFHVHFITCERVTTRTGGKPTSSMYLTFAVALATDSRNRRMSATRIDVGSALSTILTAMRLIERTTCARHSPHWGGGTYLRAARNLADLGHEERVEQLSDDALERVLARLPDEPVVADQLHVHTSGLERPTVSRRATMLWYDLETCSSGIVSSPRCVLVTRPIWK